MMVLYSKPSCPMSQQCRFVLFEKNMEFEIRDVDPGKTPPGLEGLHLDVAFPVLVDRGLILYSPNIINEYIDERFPHPQLFPGDAIERARVRLFLLNFEKELLAHIPILERRTTKENAALQTRARDHVKSRLTELVPLFQRNNYVLGAQFSVLDVALAPLLWRLELYGIQLTKSCTPLLKYGERIFARPAFIEAMTTFERVMRK